MAPFYSSLIFPFSLSLSIAALLNLANNPTLNTPTLVYQAVPTSPFQPFDAVMPPDLSVSFIPADTFTLTPTGGLAFGSVYEQNSSTLTATLTNKGTGLAAISVAITGTSTMFSQTNNCAQLAAQASCAIQVTFLPTAYNNQTAYLQVTSNASTTGLTLTLTGNASVPPAPAISPASYTTLPGSAIGTPVTGTFLLTNTGGGSLIFGAMSFNSITGGGIFSQTNNCATLNLGDSCTIYVTETPGTATGHPYAILAVPGNFNALSLQILSNGASPILTASPTSITIPATLIGQTSAPVPVTVTNMGLSPATLGTPVFYTGSTINTLFSQTNNCPTPLNVGSSCIVNAYVTPTAPTAAGAITALLEVPYSSATQSLNVNVAATGITGDADLILSEPNLFLPAVYPGPAFTPGFLDITNPNNVPIPISSISVSSSSYTLTNYCGTSIPALGTCVVMVTLTSSSSSGNGVINNATLTIAAPATPTPSRTVGLYAATVSSTGTTNGYYDGLNFGNIAVGTQSSTGTLTGIQAGQAYPTIGTLQGVNAADFTAVGANYCYQSATCTYQAYFTPSAPGWRMAQVNFIENGATNGVSLLVGFGVPANSSNAVSANPSSLTFPATAIGTSAQPMTITIANPAGHLLNYVFTTGDGVLGEYFGLYGGITNPICQATSCPLNVSFYASTAGSVTDVLTVYDTVTNYVYHFLLSGSGGTPSYSFQAPNLVLPSTSAGTPSTPQPFTFTNTGTASILVSSIGFVGTYSSLFSQTNTCGTIVLPGVTCTISISATPTASGSFNASLQILSPSLTISLVTITAIGNNTAYPSGYISPSVITLATTAVGGTSPSQTATYTNNGNVAGTFSAFTFLGASEFTLGANTCTGTIQPGGTCTITVYATAVTSGNTSASLNGTITYTSGTSSGISLIVIEAGH